MTPKPKVVAAGVGGAVVTILIALGLIDPDSDVAAAVATIVAVLFGFVKAD